MQNILVAALPELLATLIGVAVGGSIAFARENIRNRRRRDIQAFVILRSLLRELRKNHKVVTRVLPHFRNTHYGKSYFISTSVWETALATEELPAIIGFGLADTVAYHYGIMARLQYYGDLLVKVWLTQPDVDGYTEIQSGFRRIIIASLEEAIEHYPVVEDMIRDELRRLESKRVKPEKEIVTAQVNHGR